MRLWRSHRMELLFDALGRELGRRDDVLTPAVIAVPNRAMERSIEVHVARTAGIACNVRFVRIDGLLAELFVPPAPPTERWAAVPAEAARWEALVLAVLTDVASGKASDPELEPVRRWLLPGDLATDPDAVQRRALSLAGHLGELLVAYDRARPDLVRAWSTGAPVPPQLGLDEGALHHHEQWQRALVVAARRKGEALFATELLDELARAPSERSPLPLHVIGLSHTTRTGMAVLAALDRMRPVTVYALDPSQEFWEDVESGAERGRRLQRRPGELEGVASESALLAAWGRAGREHLAELNERSGYLADELFEEPGEPATALEEIQRSILERRAVRPGTPDGSVTLFGCPSVRRELEVVASEIWRRIERGARFSEVAILLHEGARERYMPLLPSVLAEAHDMPWSAVDVPLTWRSRIVAGAVRLVDVLSAEPTRGRLLDLLAHPSVRALVSEARPAAVVSMLDRLGFFAGLGDGPAPSGDGDLRQALDRMALGAVSAGERSGQERPIGRWLPEEIDATSGEGGGLHQLLRSLWADMSFARRAALEMSAWADFFDAALAAYLVTDGPGETADLLRARRAVIALRQRHLPGHRVGVEVAATVLSRELTGLRTELGAPTISGITVSTLVPMRAIPFQHVFVLGLGEGRFAAARESRGFDLRRGARLRGDVEETERDRYTFLETLLSARQSLTVSWVARDETTGEALEPAAVVSELVRAAEGRTSTITPALRRHEDVERGPIAAGALLGADAERRARSLGDLERDQLDGGAGHGAGLAISAFRAITLPQDPRRSLLIWDAVGPGPRVPSPEPASAPAGSRLASRLARPAAPAAVAALGPQATLGPQAGLGPERRVGLHALAELLQRPMQAAAEHALGAASTEEGRLDEPPIEVSRRVASQLAREVVRRALADPTRTPREHLRERAMRERARGRFPSGALGERAEDELASVVDGLLETIRTVLGSAANVAPARFGPGRTLGPGRSIALPAIDLGAGLRDRRILLVGESRAWLADHGRALVLVDPGAHLGVTKRDRGGAERALLRAFLDHAALSCGHDAIAGLGRAVHLVTPSGALSALLLPFAESAARAWLRSLADDLGAGHAAFLPGEVVLGEADRIRRGDPMLLDALNRSLDRARAKDDRLGELRGPVRDPRERPGPGPSELLRIVGRRFGPYFEHVRLPDAPRAEAR